MIITTTTNEIQVFMNTWKNYNENGADTSLINGGWMSIEEAKEFIEEQRNNNPFINDIDGYVPFEINEYSNADKELDNLTKYFSIEDRDILNAIIYSSGYDLDKCIEIFENGDYIYYSCIENEFDLGYAVVEECGLLENDNELLVRYFDYEAFGRDLVLEGYCIYNGCAILIQ